VTRLALLALLLAVPAAGQATRYVDARAGSDSADGLSDSTAYRTIGRALADVPATVAEPWTVQLAPGEYAETVRLTGLSMPSAWAFQQMLYEPMPPSITLQGPLGQPDSARIVAMGTNAPCVSAAGVVLILRSLSCQVGTYSALVVAGSTLVLDNVRLATSAAQAREGVHADRSTVYLSDSLVVRGRFAAAISLRSHSYSRPRTRWNTRLDLVVDGAFRGFFIRDQSAFTTAFDPATMHFTHVGEIVYALLDAQFFTSVPVVITGQDLGRAYAVPGTSAGVFVATDQSVLNAHTVTLLGDITGPLVRCFKLSYLVLESGTYTGANGGADTDGTCRLLY
jgi:hypothetical protein